MDGSIKPEGPVEGGESAKLDLLIRAGRGRTGGSTGLDLAVQRARYQGRRFGRDPPGSADRVWNCRRRPPNPPARCFRPYRYSFRPLRAFMSRRISAMRSSGS